MMANEVLRFITDHGVCGFTCEWDSENAKYDSLGWLDAYGTRIGSGSAPLPDGSGWIDLSRFATVTDRL